MANRHIIHVRIGNRPYRAVPAPERTPHDAPLPANLAWTLLERELHRPCDLNSLAVLLKAVSGSRLATPGKNLRHAFLSGQWSLLPPFAETPNSPIPKPEPVAEQLKAAKSVKTWIEMEVVDEFGYPQPNYPYLCMLPDGRIETGTLDSRGRVRFDGIDPGRCVFSLTDLDQETWAKAS